MVGIAVGEQLMVLVVAIMTVVVPVFVIASLVHAARRRPK